MKAIVETGGKQYYVSENDKVYVEKINGEVGSEVVLDKVLAIDSKIGTPYINGAKVICTIEKQGKQKKIKVFKYHPKKKYRKTLGHRQPYTCLVIKKING